MCAAIGGLVDRPSSESSPQYPVHGLDRNRTRRTGTWVRFKGPGSGSYGIRFRRLLDGLRRLFNGLQQSLRPEQGPADRIGRGRVESGARFHEDVPGGYGDATGGAFAVRAEFGAAVHVPEGAQLGLAEVLAAPQAERAQRGPQGDAALGDDVLVPRRRLLVAPLLQDPLRGQRL